MKKPITCLLILPFIISCRSSKEKSFCNYLFTDTKYYINYYYSVNTRQVSSFTSPYVFSSTDEGKLWVSIPTFHVFDEYPGTVNLMTKFSFFSDEMLLDEVEANAPDFFSKRYHVYIDPEDATDWGVSGVCYQIYEPQYYFGFEKPCSFFNKTILVRIDFVLTYEDGSYYDTPCYSEFLIEYINESTSIFHNIPDFRYIENN